MQPICDTENSGSNAKLPCPQCDRRFARREHLRRHLRNHGTLKRFTCPLCAKTFARSDVLAKHREVHDGGRRGGSSASQVNDNGDIVRNSRACLACAKARERCTRESQCLRCAKKAIPCVYPYTERAIDRRAQQTDLPECFGTATPEADLSASGRFHMFGQPTINSDQDDAYTVPIVNEPDSSLLPLGWPNVEQQWPFDGSTASRQTSTLYNQSINWLPFDEYFDPNLGSVFGSALDQLERPDVSRTLAVQDTDPAHTISRQNLLQSIASPISGTPRSDCSPSTASIHGGSVAASSLASHSSPSSKSTRDDFYATSTNGARNSCATRAQRESFSQTNFPTTADSTQKENSGIPGLMSFPSLALVDLSDTIPGNFVPMISEETYNIILDQFQARCTCESAFLRRFISDEFPPLAVVNHFVTLSFKYFDPILPLIHWRSLDFSKSWILVVAIASIGCQYGKSQELRKCIAPFQEFCGRAIRFETERGGLSELDLTFLQAQLLNQISVTYSGSQSVAETSSLSLVSLIESCTREQLHRFVAKSPVSSDDWYEWIRVESWRRLHFACLILRSMMTYQFNLGLEAGQDINDITLPNEKLWNAETAENWFTLHQKDNGNQSLKAVMSNLFKDKSVSADLDDFSYCIIIHELYNEIAKITIFHSRELASWTPTTANSQLQAQGSEELPNTQQGNLTVLGHSVKLSTAISDWRNAALDCIDVLHWAANAKVALRSGVEHPVVLHLHYSRVVLLVPRIALMTVASSAMKALDGTLKNNKQLQRDSSGPVEVAERHIREWVQRDSSKARLAAVHSGCFFWHIRRYSRAAFYEPIAIFYATLALWAYGFYTPKATADSTGRMNQSNSCLPIQGERDSSEGGGCNSGSESLPTSASRLPLDRRDPVFIYLDRPNDDEMVQLFVGSGHPANMSALLSGVGDLCGPEGPARILREGRALLTAASKSWSSGLRYVDILLALEKSTAEKSFRA